MYGRKNRLVLLHLTGIDHQLGDSLAVIGGVAESYLGRFSAAIKQMRVIFPGKTHAAVHLNRAIAHFAISIAGIRLGDRYGERSLGYAFLDGPSSVVGSRS